MYKFFHKTIFLVLYITTGYSYNGHLSVTTIQVPFTIILLVHFIRTKSVKLLFPMIFHETVSNTIHSWEKIQKESMSWETMKRNKKTPNYIYSK